jgi:hypothetical protein
MTRTIRALRDFAENGLRLAAGETVTLDAPIADYYLDSWGAAFEVVNSAPTPEPKPEPKQAAPSRDKQARPPARK